MNKPNCEWCDNSFSVYIVNQDSYSSWWICADCEIKFEWVDGLISPHIMMKGDNFSYPYRRMVSQ